MSANPALYGEALKKIGLEAQPTEPGGQPGATTSDQLTTTPEAVGSTLGAPTSTPVRTFPTEPPKIEDRSIHQDLEPKDLWLRNEIAASRQRQQNNEYWFREGTLGLTNEDTALREAAQREENRNVRAIREMAEEELQVDLLDPDTISRPYEELKKMLQEIPKPPKPEDYQQPSAWQGLAALVFAAFDPEHAFEYGAVPFQYQAQQRAEKDAINWRNYEADREAFMMKYNVSAAQADKLVQAGMYNIQLKNQRRETILTALFNAQARDAAMADQWDVIVATQRFDLMKMDKAQQQRVVETSIDYIRSGKGSPAQLQAAAALVKAGTGIDIPVSETNTPEYQAALDSAALIAEQLRGQKFSNQFNEDTRDAQVRRVQAETQSAEANAKIAGVEAQNADKVMELRIKQAQAAVKAAEIANKYLDEKNRLEVQQMQASIDAANASTDGQRIQNWGATQRGVSADDRLKFESAVAKAKESLNETRQGIAERKSAVMDQLKEEGKWWVVGEAGYGVGPWHKKYSAEDVKKHNDELMEQRLAEDPLYNQLVEQEGVQQNDIAQLSTLLSSVAQAGENPVSAGDLGLRYQRQGLKYSMNLRNRPDYTDCSEFTMCVYRDMGIKIPETAGLQWNDEQILAKVPRDQTAVGDLIFFRNSRSSRKTSAHHVGLIVGFDEEGYPIMRHASKANNAIVDVNMKDYMKDVGGYMTILGVKRPK